MSNHEVPSPLSWRQRVDQLDALAETLPMGRAADPSAWDASLLAALGQGGELAQLFHLTLAMALRRGPAAGRAKPAQLVSLSSRATRSGLLGAGDAVALRERLDRLATQTRGRHLWSTDTPLWWEPLPPEGRLETLWRTLEPSPESDRVTKLSLPDDATLRQGLVFSREHDDPGSRGWVSLASMASPGLTLRLSHELATIPRALGLERAAVAEGKLSTRRSDAVCYLDGREPDLLTGAPTLAVVIQWLLARIAPHLSRALDRGVHAPERAMLARYPAPSFGYAPHLDNPGGEHDNGRELTLVIYLNDRHEPCRGGEIALWRPGTSTAAEPAAVLPPTGGSAVLFDSRRVPHQVRPLEPGPPRWALTLWLSDTPRQPSLSVRAPEVSVDQILVPIEDPPTASHTVIFHRFDAPKGESDRDTGHFEAHRIDAETSPTLGVVATVYRAGSLLDDWCAHHLDLGAEHLLLVFDHLEEPAERAVAEALRERWDDRLSIWSGAETAERRWPVVPAAAREPLLAATRRQGAADAVAARQSLNASAALLAFRQGMALPRVDWLLHLDADEELRLAGEGRGGATLHEHLAAAQTAGWDRLRYLVHELLEPPSEKTPPRFKINPRLARCRLGAGGWRRLQSLLKMGQSDTRPYFRAHWNGKSAVRVERGLAAAGVHDWLLSDDRSDTLHRGAVLAGPWILHRHFTSAELFAAKYLAMAHAGPSEERLFPASGAEQAALALIAELEARGADEATLHHELTELHRRLTTFSADEITLLAEAGLLATL